MTVRAARLVRGIRRIGAHGPTATSPSRVHLADLLVATAVFGVVSARGAHRAPGRSPGLHDRRLAGGVPAERARGVERLAGEIRTAGRGPRPAAFAAISVGRADAHRSPLRPRRRRRRRRLPARRSLATGRKRCAATRAAAPSRSSTACRRFTLEYLDAARQHRRDCRTTCAPSCITLVTEARRILPLARSTALSTRARLRNR